MTGLLLVDKQTDWTSSDVVSKLRGILHERRIGHAGTLDPLATGLLIVLVGRATRASDFAMAHDKEYIAALRPGITTDTQDITGNVIAQSDKSITGAQLKDACRNFTGDIFQIPPMYSAIKINGKKLYEIARSGKEVERKPRSIRIESIDIIGTQDKDFILDIKCSAGTYIRTLCNDIGEYLGCGACMASLRRVAIGSFTVDSAHTLSEIENAMKSGAIDNLLIPTDALFNEHPQLTLSPAEEIKVKNGNIIPCTMADNLYRVYSPSGEFLMLGEVKAGRLYTVKSFFEPVNIK